jgi:hypothetical protein
MIVQKMVEIGDDSGESLELKDDDNWDNECNLGIWQDVNCFTILNGGRLSNGCAIKELDIVKNCILLIIIDTRRLGFSRDFLCQN